VQGETLPCVMEAWTLTSACFVWICAIMTVLLRCYGAALGWDWVNSPVVLAVASSVAIAFAVYADFSAMKWCIVPWLRKVRRLEVVRCELAFGCFLTFQLCSTLFQVLTIQTNAWFMVTVVQGRDFVCQIRCSASFQRAHGGPGSLRNRWRSLCGVFLQYSSSCR